MTGNTYILEEWVEEGLATVLDNLSDVWDIVFTISKILRNRGVAQHVVPYQGWQWQAFLGAFLAVCLFNRHAKCERIAHKVLFTEAAAEEERLVNVCLVFMLQIATLEYLDPDASVGIILKSFPLKASLF